RTEPARGNVTEPDTKVLGGAAPEPGTGLLHRGPASNLDRQEEQLVLELALLLAGGAHAFGHRIVGGDRGDLHLLRTSLTSSLRTHRTSVRVATDMRPKPQQPGETCTLG